jgi:hypothetical protein
MSYANIVICQTNLVNLVANNAACMYIVYPIAFAANCIFLQAAEYIFLLKYIAETIWRSLLSAVGSLLDYETITV